MATAEPPFDPDDEFFGRLFDDFERLVFPRGESEEAAKDAMREYARQAGRPYVCTLFADVLGGRWKLGETQEEVADRLEMDRTRVSDALRKGELSMATYLRLRTCPTRPKDWEPDVDRLRAQMRRSGFIAVAQHYAKLVPGRPELIPEQMDELHHELVCEVVRDVRRFLTARLAGDPSVARAIVARVVGDPDREVVPAWYTSHQRKQADALIGRLRGSDDAAYAHLVRLQTNWLDVVAYAHGTATQTW